MEFPHLENEDDSRSDFQCSGNDEVLWQMWSFLKSADVFYDSNSWPVSCSYYNLNVTIDFRIPWFSIQVSISSLQFHRIRILQSPIFSNWMSHRMCLFLTIMEANQRDCKFMPQQSVSSQLLRNPEVSRRVLIHLCTATCCSLQEVSEYWTQCWVGPPPQESKTTRDDRQERLWLRYSTSVWILLDNICVID